MRERTIPFKVLKSSAFQLALCRQNILENLVVKELEAKEKRSELARNAVDFPMPVGASGGVHPTGVSLPSATQAYNRLSGVVSLEVSRVERPLPYPSR